MSSENLLSSNIPDETLTLTSDFPVVAYYTTPIRIREIIEDIFQYSTARNVIRNIPRDSILFKIRKKKLKNQETNPRGTIIIRL